MNVYNNCPLDAREFTDYRSTSTINNVLMTQNNIKNSFEFNNFLKKDGLKMFNKKKADLEKTYNCGNNDIDNKYNVNPNDINTENLKPY